MEGSSHRRFPQAWLSLPIVVAAILLGYANSHASLTNDPHHTEAGYFDLNVCQWSDRPVFLMALFASTRFDEVQKVEVFRPDGKPLGKITFAQYESAKDQDGQERRTFKTQLPLPQPAMEGWYSSTITLTNGKQYTARDYVRVQVMPIVTGIAPKNGSENVSLPAALRWKPLPGEVHYRVFIKDAWQDKKVVFKSDLLTEPHLTLPKGVLEPNGSYVWQIHARDAADDPKWGEFNHGSMSAEVALSVKK